MIQSGLELSVHRSPSYTLCRRPALCRRSLVHWNKFQVGNFNFRLDQLQTKILKLQDKIVRQGGPWPQDLQDELKLLEQYEHVLHVQNIHWAQKTRINWMHLEDNNVFSYGVKLSACCQ